MYTSVTRVEGAGLSPDSAAVKPLGRVVFPESLITWRIKKCLLISFLLLCTSSVPQQQTKTFGSEYKRAGFLNH